MIHWLRLSIVLLLAAVFSACDDPDPLAPSFSASRGGAPAAPTNLTATPYSYEMLTFAWQDNATNEAGFEVWRSTDGPSGTFSLFTTYPFPNSTQGGNSGLQAATQYCYEVRAYNTLGQSGKIRTYSAFSNVACATTLPLPVPAAPSGVNAAPQYDGYAIRVTWTDNSSNETGFRVERSAADIGPWTSVGTANPNVTSLDDWQVPGAEQPACYRVFAVNSYGASGPSNVDCTAVPLAPTNLVATVQNDGSVDLSWADNSAVEDSFAVYRWTAYGSFDRVATLLANTTTYHDPWTGDSTFYYRVYATKDGGRSAGSNTVAVSVVSIPPAAPLNLDALPQSSSSILSTWVPGSGNAEGFRVERSTDGGASWTVATVDSYGTSFWETGLPSEQQVCYRAIAFNVKGDSPPSNVDCTTPPAAPSHLVAAAAETGAIDLSWTDNSGVEDGYAVLRLTLLSYCDDYGCYDYYDYDQIATVGANVTSYHDARLTPGESNSYVVVALKDGGQSDRSNDATAIAP
ncbi:MAG TPA: hypothetical protein VGQ29_09135 [Gemmatimonadales bacterium]|jgi:titin|nr:hypothetical protein [Gemmatimonadales bacterium]